MNYYLLETFDPSSKEDMIKIKSLKSNKYDSALKEANELKSKNALSSIIVPEEHLEDMILKFKRAIIEKHLEKTNFSKKGNCKRKKL